MALEITEAVQRAIEQMMALPDQAIPSAIGVMQRECANHIEGLDARDRERLKQIHRNEMPQLGFAKWLNLRLCAKAACQSILLTSKLEDRRDAHWLHLHRGLSGLVEAMEIPPCFGTECTPINVDAIYDRDEVQGALQIIQRICEDHLAEEGARQRLGGSYEPNQQAFPKMFQWLYLMVLLCHVTQEVREATSQNGENDGDFHWLHTLAGLWGQSTPCPLHQD